WAVRCCSRTLRRLPRPDPAIEGGVGGTCAANWAADPLSGVINARIQTWFPFTIEVCINGREWLARMMDVAGLGYVQRENCFPWLEDPQRAQRLMDQQMARLAQRHRTRPEPAPWGGVPGVSGRVLLVHLPACMG